MPGDVEVVDGRVTGYGLPSPNGRGIASPGFVDLQVNGFGGVDFLDTDAAGYEQAGAALLETGVTAYLPTLITPPRSGSSPRSARSPKADRGPRILGAHVEGPFLSPRRLGTHPPSARRDPDPALLERLLSAGPVRLFTLAPELPGALDLVDKLVARGITVSAGHTDASAEEADAAFGRGVRTVTHLFNAMRPFTHRDPGVTGAALARPDVTVQIILDGVHLAPDTVRMVWQAAGGRLALVTDAVAGAGASDGSYRLGDVSVEVRDGVVRRDGDGVLAGSVLTMIDAVRNLHALGVPLEAALDAATAVPARVIGADAGRIEIGAPRTSSSSAKNWRSSVSSLPARPVSPPEPGALYLAEIREQPAALRQAAGAARRRSSAVAEAARGTNLVRIVGHGSSDNAAVVRRVRLRAPARADRDARLDQPHRLLRREARPPRVDGDRAVPVGPDAGRPRVRDTGAQRGRVHDRVTNDERVRSRAGGRRTSSRSPPATSSRSPRRRPTRTRSPRSRSSPRMLAGRGDEVAGQLETVAEQQERQIPLLERAVASIAVPFASVGRMFVIGRGPEFATAREIALKLLETCQIAAEPLTATDLAHGPVAALDPLFPVWAVATDDGSLDVVVEAAARVRAAGATLIASGPAADAIADAQFRLPVPTPPAPLLAPLLSVVAGPALRGRGRPGEGARSGQAARAVEGHAGPR